MSPNFVLMTAFGRGSGGGGITFTSLFPQQPVRRLVATSTTMATSQLVPTESLVRAGTCDMTYSTTSVISARSAERSVVECSRLHLPRAADAIGVRVGGNYGSGIAALDQEGRKDGMKDRSVVKAGLGHVDEVCDGRENLVGEEGDVRVAELRLND